MSRGRLPLELGLPLQLWFEEGRFPFNQISRNSGPKLNGTVLSNRKIFGREGPPFEVDRFFRSDRSDRKLLFHWTEFRFQSTFLS